MVKDGQSGLDAMVFITPELRTVETNEDFRVIKESFVSQQGCLSFLTEKGSEWSIIIDKRRGVPSLIDGGVLPIIPGFMNDLDWQSFEPGCTSIQCLSKKKVEECARAFLKRYEGLFPISQEELVLDPEGTLPFGESIYMLRFQWIIDDIPVEGGSIFFRINSGNLLQVASSHIAPMNISTEPQITVQTAWELLDDYLGKNVITENDRILGPGELALIPITPRGLDANVYLGPIGEMYDYILCYRLVFERPGIIGTWEALIDAHTGDLIRFVDANRYGNIQGGVYKTDRNPTQTEVIMPLPFVDYGTGLFSDITGSFSGTSGTSTLTGRIGSTGVVGGVVINDNCGLISLSADPYGLIDFGFSTGTDCTTPGFGSDGNTHAARTQYYNISWVKIKAYNYFPGNTWLEGLLSDNVNINSTCNAYWNGSSINFYRSGGGCGNTGEIPGIALHEWGHGMDDNDGSGGISPPVETRADWTAILQTHQSCAGGGFFDDWDQGCGVTSAGYNCDGYGDCCLACSGIREADWAQHTSNTPWTPANNVDGGGILWGPCGFGSYQGPCGWEDHCEAGFSTQALWDLVNRDLPTYCSMDVASSWQLIDRLWYGSMPQLGDMYTCTPPTSDGCGSTSLFNLFRAIDDTGDGTSNGTPHAQAIYQAFARHSIACGAAGDTSNQNQTTCPSLTTPTLTGISEDNDSVYLSWSSVSNATRYFIFRNDTSCEAGFTQIATVSAPTTSYTDNTVMVGISSYYRVQAATANDACVSALSNCVAVTPQPCGGEVMLEKVIYNCAATVTVMVCDSSVVSPVQVEAWSTTDSSPKTITLTGSPSTYSGIFETTSGPAGPEQVQVSDGDILFVSYTDPDYCGTPDVTVDMNSAIDCIYPVITNVQVTNITDSSAIVTWQTDENANSQLMFGLAVPPDINVEDLTNYETEHSLTLTGLSACTTYYFTVTSTDPAGNSTTADNGGACYSFMSYGRIYLLGPEDVESGTDGWTLTGEWHQDTCRVHGGSYAFKLGSTECPGTYSNDLTSDLTWATAIDLGNAGHGFHLKFWEYYRTEIGYDFCRPQISTNGGSTWTNLVVQYTGVGTSWALREIDLADYSSTVYIRFEFYADGIGATEGWYLDDIEISKPISCTADPVYQSNTFSDNCSGGGAGDNNGYIDAGETITVRPVLKNVGTEDATGISATLSTTTPGVTVTGTTATYPDLAIDETGACEYPYFTFVVSSGMACESKIEFSLLITAVTGGGPWTQNFTMFVGDITYTPATAFTESFDGTTFPPTGWVETDVSGTTGDWSRVTSSTYPNATPHSGAAFAKFNSYNASTGDMTRLSRTTTFSIPSTSPTATAVMWVYHDTLLAGGDDQIQVQTSADGLSWTDQGDVIHRYDGTTGWKEHTFDLSSLIGDGDFQIGYLGISDSGMNMYLDDVSVEYMNSSCTQTICTSCTLPSAPVINTITDSSGNCGFGISISYSAGTPVTRHDLYRDAVKVVDGYSSGSSYDPGDTASHSYVVRAINGNDSCYTDSTASSFSDTNNSPTPFITGDSANICPAETVLLSTEAGMNNYQWYESGSPLGGANTYQYTVTATGNYTVSYTNMSGCSGTSNAHVVTISPCQPNIVFSSYGLFVEMTGNGNAYYERGEKWSVDVTLTNTGTMDATNVSASLNGNGIEVCVPNQSFGNIALSGSGSATFEFVISTSFSPCGDSIGFDVVNKACSELTPAGPDEFDLFSVNVGEGSSSSVTLFGPDDDPYNSGYWTSGGSSQSETHCSPSTAIYYRVNRNSNGALVDSISTVGYSAIHVLFDAGATNTGVTLYLDYSINGGTSYTNIWSRTGASTWACIQDVTLPSDCEGITALKIRFRCTSGGVNQRAKFDNVTITGTGSFWDCSYIGSGTCQSCEPPSTPVISTILDNDPCSQTGITITYSSGSPATTHDLYRDMVKVVDDYISGSGYDPGDTSSHNYVIRAINGEDDCYTDSSAVAETDANGGITTAPIITGLTDHDPAVQDGIYVFYSAGSPSTSHDLYMDGAAFITDYVSGTLFNPGDTNSHNYVIRTNNGSCYADSNSQVFTDAASGVPPEITPLAWTDSTTTTWPEEPTATNGYILYRGQLADLPNLLNANQDFCIRSTTTGSGDTSISTLSETAPVNDCYFFIVVGVNGAGEGSAGSASSGERELNNTGTCP